LLVKINDRVDGRYQLNDRRALQSIKPTVRQETEFIAYWQYFTIKRWYTGDLVYI